MRRILKRHLPDRKTVRDHRHLRHFGAVLQASALWHLNRRSVAGGLAVGLFAAFLPIPLQTILAAALAIALRVNLPVAVVAVWVTNPLTMPPAMYVEYKLGAWLLDMHPQPIRPDDSFHWLLAQTGRVWKPLVAGSLILATAAATTGYLTVRLLWRVHVLRLLRGRRRQRALAAASPPSESRVQGEASEEVPRL